MKFRAGGRALAIRLGKKNALLRPGCSAAISRVVAYAAYEVSLASKRATKSRAYA